MSCAQIAACALNCTDDFGCLINCYNQGSEQGKGRFWDLMTFAIGSCGFPSDLNCMPKTFGGACKSQFNTCLAN